MRLGIKRIGYMWGRLDEAGNKEDRLHVVQT